STRLNSCSIGINSPIFLKLNFPLKTLLKASNSICILSVSTSLRAIIGFNVLNKRSEEHTSELQSRFDLVCRLLLEKKKTDTPRTPSGRISDPNPVPNTSIHQK